MSSEDLLTLVVAQGSSGPDAVSRSVLSVSAADVPLDFRVMAASSQDARQIRSATESAVRAAGHALRIVHPVDAEDDDAVIGSPGQYLGVLPVGGTLTAHTIRDHLRALEEHPEAVLTLRWGRGGAPHWPLPNETSGTIDGRLLARSLIGAFTTAGATPSLAVARSGAVDRGDLPAAWTGASRQPSVDPEWLLAILRILSRGSAWCERPPDSGDSGGSNAHRHSHLHRWNAVMEVGVQLDFVDRTDAWHLLLEQTRAVADVLSPAGQDAAPGGSDRSELVHAVVAAWEAQLPERCPPTSRNSDRQSDWLPTYAAPPRDHVLRKFIIAAPSYTERHGGVVALHRLCDRLNVAGYEAYLEPTGPTMELRPGWHTPLRRGRSFNDAVVVYPEVISGNPFTASRVVRWLLNRPTWFTGQGMDESSQDLVVAFNDQISAQLPILELPLIDPTIFWPKKRAGHGSLLWIGKGVLPPGFDRSGTTLITRTWPATRPALAERLRNADVLYSCDWLSSLIDESLLCGTPVTLIGGQTWSVGEVRHRPGLAVGDVALEEARQLVSDYSAHYLDGLPSVEPSIERFVQLVNDHFAI